MTIGIEKFRAAQGDRLVMKGSRDGKPDDVTRADLSLGSRFRAWRSGGSFRYGTAVDQAENRHFKSNFYAALIKAEGLGAAQCAVRAAGLPPNWSIDCKPLSAMQVAKVLDKAQEIRIETIRRTKENAAWYGDRRNNGTPSLKQSLNDLSNSKGYRAADFTDSNLRARVSLEIVSDAEFAKRDLDAAAIDAIARRAIDAFYSGKAQAFVEQHPGLADFSKAGHAGMPRQDCRTFHDELKSLLDPNTARNHVLAREPVAFRALAIDSLSEIQSNAKLLGEVTGDAKALQQLGEKILAKHNQLEKLAFALENMNDVTLPKSDPGKDMRAGLIKDIRHQQALLQAKGGFISDIMYNHPLSMKAVAHSDLLWAKAAGYIFDQAADLMTASAGSKDAIASLKEARTKLIEARTSAYDSASRAILSEAPNKQNKDTHPVVMGKKDVETYLQSELKRAGLSSKDIQRLTDKDNLSEARTRAMKAYEGWAPVKRDMVVTRDGRTCGYTSLILPGASISQRFERRLAVDGIKGIPSTEKASQDHARNLKVSVLQRGAPDGSPQTMATVVGHGVLDMWNIADPGQRRAANERGAHEVLEAAIVSNDRVTTEALKRSDNKDGAPVRITHVSINLTTPAAWRELPGLRGTNKLRDYQELTYTREQFRAFEANSSSARDGQPIAFQIDDTRAGGGLGTDVVIAVNVEAITFSFGINPLATGFDGVFGGWDQVYEHNRGEMVKFVGDLGSGEAGALGARPGGFIGSVYDRLDANDPDQAALMAKIRAQTIVVRSLFTHEDFRRGNGDPAKMGREILALQAYAEQVLQKLNVVDQAATMSKGCKSDKDRGGVTDVELKHKLITEDMGGIINADQRLNEEDQANYYVVAMASGQLENQQLNTGVPGSKEAGKLKERIPDPSVRRYLEGMGAFASE